jgi:hypothetical protein
MTLDHSVLITRRYAELWSRYEAMGFTLTPPSRHEVTTTEGGPLKPSCTANRCAVFGHNYVELIGIVDDAAPDPWQVRKLLDRYEGLHGLSFALDAATALSRLGELAGSGVLTLRREISTPHGPVLMRARTVHVDRARTPEGILHTAEHLTPEYVHQKRFLGHANGARGLAEVLLVVEDAEIEAYRNRYATMLGARHDVRILPVSALDEVLPGETAPVLPYFAAQTVLVDDLDRARDLLSRNGFTPRDSPGGFFVRAEEAGGTSVVFHQRTTGT